MHARAQKKKHAKAGKKSGRRRTAVASAVVLAVLAAFTVRLVDIQVVNAQEHLDNRASISGLVRTEELYGTRGSITDMDGNVLASSTMRYSAALDPSLITAAAPAAEDEEEDAGRVAWGDSSQSIDAYSETVSWRAESNAIGKIVGMEGEDVRAVAADSLADNPDSRWAQLATDLSTQQYRELLELGLPYLTFEPQQSRAYPYGAVAGNLIGFTNSEGPLAGLEDGQNACLQGSNGELTYQQGPRGLMIPGTETVEPAVDGGTVELTIDADLQWYLQQMLAEEVETQQALRGMAMVVEVGTGAVRAAAEVPSVDPNDYTATEGDDRGARIFSAAFEPGSTFKAITAATLLDQGAATPFTPVQASDFETFPNGAAVGDSFSHPTYNYTLAGALIDSSNVALSKLGELVPDEVRAEYLQRFGVGTPTGIGFPGEEAGNPGLPVDQWDAQTHYATTFGQAFTTTMPQVVGAYQTLANGGVRQPLHLIESCTDASGEKTEPELSDPTRVVSEEAADTTMQILENVATQGPVAEQAAVEGYRIALKTGTAQKPDGRGGYLAGRYFTSIVGVVPADDPQYVVMVTLDEPTRVTSSAATAPALHKALMQVVKSYRIMPSEEPGEQLPKFAD
jgi:cell division protein FtsI (penicillin-binding protein 3)